MKDLEENDEIKRIVREHWRQANIGNYYLGFYLFWSISTHSCNDALGNHRPSPAYDTHVYPCPKN